MKTLLAAGFLGLCAVGAFAAETRLRPGQWEITTQSDMGGMKQQMPKLTPAQIAQMEKADIEGSSGAEECLELGNFH